MLARTGLVIGGGMASQKAAASVLGRLIGPGAKTAASGALQKALTGAASRLPMGATLAKAAGPIARTAAAAPGYAASFAAFHPGMMAGNAAGEWLFGQDTDEHGRLAQALQDVGGPPPDYIAQQQTVRRMVNDDVLRQAIEEIMAEGGII